MPPRKRYYWASCTYPIFVKVGDEFYPEHRVVVEEYLGRKLKTSEVVHHMDRDKCNNDIENLSLFFNSRAHGKHHGVLNRLKNKALWECKWYENRRLAWIKVLNKIKTNLHEIKRSESKRGDRE